MIRAFQSDRPQMRKLKHVSFYGRLLPVCSLSIRNPLKDAREELPRSGLLARFAKFTSTSTALIRA